MKDPIHIIGMVVPADTLTEEGMLPSDRELRRSLREAQPRGKAAMAALLPTLERATQERSESDWAWETLAECFALIGEVDKALFAYRELAILLLDMRMVSRDEKARTLTACMDYAVRHQRYTEAGEFQSWFNGLAPSAAISNVQAGPLPNSNSMENIGVGVLSVGTQLTVPASNDARSSAPHDEMLPTERAIATTGRRSSDAQERLAPSSSNQEAGPPGSPDLLRDTSKARLIEIEAFYSAKIRASALEVCRPDFEVPPDEMRGIRPQAAKAKWTPIPDMFRAAERQNQVSYKISDIAKRTKELLEQYPESPSLRRHLAYFLYLKGNLLAAINEFREAAILSNSPAAWQDLAAAALKAEDYALASHAFSCLFSLDPITGRLEAWYSFLATLAKTGDWGLLLQWPDQTQRRLSTAEERLLWEANAFALLSLERGDTARMYATEGMSGAISTEATRQVNAEFGQRISADTRRVAMEFRQATAPPPTPLVQRSTLQPPKSPSPNTSVPVPMQVQRRAPKTLEPQDDWGIIQMQQTETRSAGHSVDDLERLTLDVERSIQSLAAIRTEVGAQVTRFRNENSRDRLVPGIRRLLDATISDGRFSNTEKAQALQYAGEVMRSIGAYGEAAAVFETLPRFASGVQERATASGDAAECYLRDLPPQFERAIPLLTSALRAAPDNKAYRTNLVRSVRRVRDEGSNPKLVGEVRSAFPDVVHDADEIDDTDLDLSIVSSLALKANAYVAFVVKTAEYPMRVQEAGNFYDLREARECWKQGDQVRRQTVKNLDGKGNQLFDPQDYRSASLWFGGAARIYHNLAESNEPCDDVERLIAWSSYLGTLGPYHLATAFGGIKTHSGRVDQTKVDEIEAAADVAADLFIEARLLNWQSRNHSGAEKSPGQTGLINFLDHGAVKASLIAAFGWGLAADQHRFPLNVRSGWPLKSVDRQDLKDWCRVDSARPGLAHLGFRVGRSFLFRRVWFRHFSNKVQVKDLLLGQEFEDLQRDHDAFEKACVDSIGRLGYFDNVVEIDHQLDVMRRTSYVLRRTDAKRVAHLVETIEDLKGLRGLQPRTMIERLGEQGKRLEDKIKEFEKAPTYDGITLLLPVYEHLLKMVRTKDAEQKNQFRVKLMVQTQGVDCLADRITFELRIENQGETIADGVRVRWDPAANTNLAAWTGVPTARVAPQETEPIVLDVNAISGMDEVPHLEFSINASPPAEGAISLPCTIVYKEHLIERRLNQTMAINLSPPAPAGKAKGDLPYEVRSGNGVEPWRVRGREDIIKQLMDLTIDPESYRSQKSIYGLPRAGKTSVLRSWAHTILKERPIVRGRPVLPVRINVAPRANNPFNMIAYNMINYLSEEIRQDWTDDQLPDVTIAGQAFARRLKADIDVGCTNAGPDRVLWERVVNGLREEGIWTILMLDEFDLCWSKNRDNLGEGFFNEMRTLSDDWGSVAYCGLWKLYDIFSDPEDALAAPQRSLSTMKKIRMHPLTKAGVIEIIGDCPWWEPEDSAVDRMMELSGGEPALVTILCARLWATASQKIMTRAAVDWVAEDKRTHEDYNELMDNILQTRADFTEYVPDQHLATILYDVVAREQTDRTTSFGGLTVGELFERARRDHHLEAAPTVTLESTERVAKRLVERGWLTQPEQAVPQYRIRAEMLATYLTRHGEDACLDAVAYLRHHGQTELAQGGGR